MLRIDNPWVCASSLVGWALIGWFLVSILGCGDGGGATTPLADSRTAPLPPTNPTPAVQPDMVTATPLGLLRGKANGQGQQLIFARPNLHQGDVFLSNGLVYYPREAPSIILDYPNQDIWSVRADGSQDHAVLNTTADEFVLDAQGNVAIYERGVYTIADGLARTDYGSLRDGAPLTVLPITERFTGYRFMVGTKAFFANEHQIYSTNVDGSALSTHATVVAPLTLAAADAIDNTLIFREYNVGTGTSTLKAIPVSGGVSTPLDDGLSYVSYAGHVGSRVVYQQCVIEIDEDGLRRAGPCDVVSVDANGSGRALLASQGANEAVQGLVGSQVIIRRNLAGNDQLIAVPVGGGAERQLMTMTDSEFVQLVIGDRLLMGRPSGSWLLDLNGALIQISNVAGSGSIVIGNAVCLNRGAAVWCMPLDGSTPAVKIADTGKVIGAL